jgi:hypothetical protein
MKRGREIPKGHRRDKPLVLRGERLIEETRNIDGEPALVLWSSKGWYILREWDKFYGWGDRAYRTLAEATRHMHGPLKTEANMARAKKNAAAGAEKVVIAFLEGRKAREGRRPDYMAGARYETDGKSLVQWGSVIAKKEGRSIAITDAGWRTKTTMAMLNSVLARVAANARIYQKSHEWFLSTPQGTKPWKGSAIINLDGATVEGNRGKRANPLSRAEAARALRWAKGNIEYGKMMRGLPRTAATSFGRARGIAGVVRVMGPKAATKAAIKMGDRADLASDLYLKNGLSCLKNLHTARERAYAKRLITRYWVSGKAALVAGKTERAAHAYGALAAIRRIARFELPHAQTVANLASFRMDLLRRAAKDLARYRKGAR